MDIGVLQSDCDEPLQKKALDKFYTKSSITKLCVKHLLGVLIKIGYDIKEITFIEPSAGGGAWVKTLEENNISSIRAYDIVPTDSGIIKRDFLKVRLKYRKDTVTIGNPPFGKKSILAIEFFNHCSSMCDTIAFIVPLQFRKWSVQSKLDTTMRLISDITLDENSFTTPEGKDYKVRCCFQIWTKKSWDKNFRLKKVPSLSHKDFEIWQYNNTKETLKYFDNAFDFAVPRQGYCDYSRRETDKEKCEKTTQWMLFKAKNKKVLKNLMELDFEKLSKNNITIPGFGKADVVMQYSKVYKKS